VQSCPTGASHVDEATGTTQVDKELCTGCKACIASCPYDARFVHPDGFVDKCTLCAGSLQAGSETACESVCPTSAIVVGDLNDAQSEIRRRIDTSKVRQLKTSAGTKPRFFLSE
jgi:Fe-S-cluster-containing dehydrogenase component